MQSDMIRLHERFRAVPDDQWFNAWIAATADPTMGFPPYPHEDVQLSLNGQKVPASLHQAFAFYSFVKQQLRSHFGDVHPTLKMLDFGAGWGRITRFFLKDIHPKNIMACNVTDISRSIWAETLPGIAFHQNARRLPLPDEIGAMDFVYAHSVWSHMPRDLSDVWAREIASRIKSGGLFIVTTLAPHTLSGVRGDPILEKWASSPDDVLKKFNRGDVVYEPMPNQPEWGWTMIPEQYVKHRWTDFDDVSYTANPDLHIQAIFVLQRR